MRQSRMFEKIKQIPLLKHVSIWTFPSLLETLAKSIVMGIVIVVLPKEEFGLISIAMLFF